MEAAPLKTSESADEVVLELGDRRWRIRGLLKNMSYEHLRVNVLVARSAGGFFVDTLELYSARQRAAFAKQASLELEVDERIVHRDLGTVLLRLEEHQDAQIKAVLEPKANTVTMTDAEHRDAVATDARHATLAQSCPDSAVRIFHESTELAAGRQAMSRAKSLEPPRPPSPYRQGLRARRHVGQPEVTSGVLEDFGDVIASQAVRPRVTRCRNRGRGRLR